MNISTRVENRLNNHQVFLKTDDSARSITIPSKSDGYGSSANGGELLFLALATCYCNDIYREAAKKNIVVEFVDVEVNGDFEGVGLPATNVTYQATVKAKASETEIRELMYHTDQVAEIQNSLRAGIPITLGEINAVAIS